MLTAVRVSGADAGAFLHGQLTADIAALEPDSEKSACYAAYCSPKGRVLATLFVVRQPDHFLLLMDPGLVESLVQRLRMYVLRAQVNLEPQSDLDIAGQISGAIKEPAADGSYAGLAVEDARLVRLPDQRVILLDASGLMDDDSEWRRLNIEQGVAWVGQATTDLFVPQMLALDVIGAVSFTKGCYPGQEVVARARYLGRIKRHLRRFEAAAALAPGQSIHSGQDAIARVVDCVAAGDGKFAGHAVVRIDQDERATEPAVGWL